ncbi:MAG TPA: HAD family hydrolase [Brevundimonas sp.]|nr:HAD family hydrolase [Brevundimonas sp.]
MSSGVPAVFLDRDGVLIEDTGYPHLEAHLRMTPGAGEAVRRLNDAGYLCVIVTNQSGVARGMFTESQMHAFNALVVQRVAGAGGEITAVYACPFHADGVVEGYIHPDHPDRKPNPGMILRAVADLGIDRARSFMIGDQPSDMEAARRADVAGYLFRDGDLDAFVTQVLGERSEAPVGFPAPMN